MKHSGVTSGKGAAKPITGYNAASLDRSKGDSKTNSWMSSGTRSPHASKVKHTSKCGCSSWGGNVKR